MNCPLKEYQHPKNISLFYKGQDWARKFSKLQPHHWVSVRHPETESGQFCYTNYSISQHLHFQCSVALLKIGEGGGTLVGCFPGFCLHLWGFCLSISFLIWNSSGVFGNTPVLYSAAQTGPWVPRPWRPPWCSAAATRACCQASWGGGECWWLGKMGSTRPMGPSHRWPAGSLCCWVRHRGAWIPADAPSGQVAFSWESFYLTSGDRS